MKWRTKNDEHPDHDCQCLVDHFGWMILTWNSHFKVWDDAEGDDYFCDADGVDKWIPLKEIIDSIE